MENVKNILDLLLQPKNNHDDWKINLIKNWPTIIGNLHDKVSLQKIHSTSVVLGVYDNSWMQELYLLSKLILKKINSHLDRPRIESIRFQCITSCALKNNSSKKYTKKDLKILGKTEKTIILKPQESIALQKIDDPLLSDALQGFLKRCRQ